MNFIKDLEFSLKLEEMKKVLRRTRVIGESRRENDAEHSWHVATMAMLLARYANEELRDRIDIDHVIRMLLVHDIVEIYAGDTFAYDTSHNADKHDREMQAMERICSELGEENAAVVDALWREFEAGETASALFAGAIDRLQPMMTNIHCDDGGTWSEYGVTKTQIYKRMEPVAKVSRKMHAYLLEKVDEQIARGFVIDR